MPAIRLKGDENMRTISDADIDGDVRWVDWKEGADRVLACVDDQLARFGLEVVMFDNEDDSFAWKIEKRISAPRETAPAGCRQSDGA